MPRRIAILGAGSEARVVYDIFREDGRKDQVLGFIDPLKKVDPQTNYYDQKPLLCGKDFIVFLKENDIKEVVLALGDNQMRQTLCEQVKKLGVHLVEALHPTASIAQGVKLAEGVIIHAGAIIGIECRIGTGTIINTATSVDHDNTIGDFCHIAPGTHLAGNVTIGEKSFLGVGVSVIPGITIGKQCTIGAGSVVLDSLPDGVTAVGAPARIIKKEEGSRLYP